METKLISSTLVALLALGLSFSAHAAKPLEAKTSSTVVAAGEFTQYFSFTTTADYKANKETLYATGISGGASLSGPFSALSINVIKDGTFSSGFITGSVPAGSNSLQATFSDSAYSWDLLANKTYTLVVKGITTATNSTYNVQGNYLTNITPVPEPASYAMLLAGLGVMATIARRRRGTHA